MNFIFCELKKAQKTWIGFFTSLKKLQKHGCNFFQKNARAKKARIHSFGIGMKVQKIRIQFFCKLQMLRHAQMQNVKTAKCFKNRQSHFLQIQTVHKSSFQ